MNDLTTFRLDGKDEIDIYDFNGENFRSRVTSSTFINLPSRTKKRPNGEGDKRGQRETAYCPYQDFQLYDIPALKEILKREDEIATHMRVLKRVGKEMKRNEKKKRKSEMEKGENGWTKM